jgi:Protein of unknown function (DUF3892)
MGIIRAAGCPETTMGGKARTSIRHIIKRGLDQIMSIRITCISKDGGNHDNPHVAISSLGWVNEDNQNKGNSTRLEIYDWIKDKDGYAYVRDASGNTVRVGTAVTASGTKYVRTYRDQTWTDNLLALPEC